METEHPLIEPSAVRLARIETKLDHFLMKQEDQETRLRASEGQLKALWGGGSILAAVVSFVVLLGGLIPGVRAHG